jgi:hypothetical protein
MLGLTSYTPFYESPSAHLFCAYCDVDARDERCYRPYSFHRQECDGGCAPFTRRSLDSLNRDIATALQLPTKAAQAAFCQSKGMKPEKLKNYAWNPDLIPHVDATAIPQDVLHMFADGVLRSEGAWLIYDMVKNGNLAWEKLLKASATYRGFPADVRVPALHPKLLQGAKGGVPKAESTLRMSGSQVHHFTLHRYRPHCLHSRSRSRFCKHCSSPSHELVLLSPCAQYSDH